MDNNTLPSQNDTISLGENAPQIQNPVENKKPDDKKSLTLTLIGILIVLFLTAATVWLIINYPLNKPKQAEPTGAQPSSEPVRQASPAAETKTDSQSESFKNLSSGNAVSDIEADVNNTNVDSIDTELQDLENTFNSF